MFQFGIRAHDLGPLSAEKLAEALAVHRPASIQLALAKALDPPGGASGSLSPGYARHIRRLLEERGIEVAVLGCYINPVHPDPEVRESSLVRFEEHLRYARDFGCSLVGTETGYLSPDGSPHPDTAKPATFDLLCRSLERLLRSAESHGVLLGIEPVADKHTLSSVEKTETLLRRLDSPNLQIIYDPVNLIPETGLKEDQESFFRRAFDAFGPRIAAVHAKDYRVMEGRKSEALPAGTGELDYPLFFRLLGKIKPQVDVLLEDCTPATMAPTLACLRRLAEETSST